MTLAASILAALVAVAAPKPKAVGYSFAAGRCAEEVPAGETEVHSRLAVGTPVRLSASVEFTRPCGRGKSAACRATPLEVKAVGSLALASVRGTDIRLEARAPGRGTVTVRARKKLFPELGLNAAVPAGLSARSGAVPDLRALRVVQGGTLPLSLAVVDEERSALCAGGKVPISAPALGLGAGATWELTAQKEVRAVGAPGWSFLDVRLGGQRLMMPVEVVSPGAVQKLVLEPRPAQQGTFRVTVRAFDETGEVLGASVRLWLTGDGTLSRVGHSDRALRELETTDAEVAVLPGRSASSLVLSAQTRSGVIARVDLPAALR